MKNFKRYLAEVREAQYTSLNDASNLFKTLAKGQTEIWYTGKAIARSASFLEQDGLLPTDVKDLKKNWVLLGKIKEKDRNEIFRIMQGENWSPLGQANSLIMKLKLTHTSMSVGDIIKTKEGAFLVDMPGFKKVF